MEFSGIRNIHNVNLNSVVPDHCRVFGAVLVTGRNVTYALKSAPDASQAYESGKKMLSLMQSSDRREKQEHERQVRFSIKGCT